MAIRKKRKSMACIVPGILWIGGQKTPEMLKASDQYFTMVTTTNNYGDLHDPCLDSPTLPALYPSIEEAMLVAKHFDVIKIVSTGKAGQNDTADVVNAVVEHTIGISLDNLMPSQNTSKLRKIIMTPSNLSGVSLLENYTELFKPQPFARRLQGPTLSLYKYLYMSRQLKKENNMSQAVVGNLITTYHPSAKILARILASNGNALYMQEFLQTIGDIRSMLRFCYAHFEDNPISQETCAAAMSGALLDGNTFNRPESKLLQEAALNWVHDRLESEKSMNLADKIIRAIFGDIPSDACLNVILDEGDATSNRKLINRTLHGCQVSLEAIFAAWLENEFHPDMCTQSCESYAK